MCVLLSGVMFQISGYEYRCVCRLCVICLTNFKHMVFSNVCEYFPLFSIFITSILSVIIPYVYPAFNIWFEYPELSLLLPSACICSLYPV
jgi:hypothetical protein